MGKSQETWNKKEKEKKKKKKKEDKEKRKEERKANSDGGSLDNMLAYVDENGVISSTPPDPSKKQKVKAENIEIGIPRKEDMDEADLLRTGIVTFFNESKGYGFIKDSNTQESIFVHMNGLTEPIVENNKVTFMTEKGQKGLNAIDVKVVR